jgi:hypothetical protein
MKIYEFEILRRKNFLLRTSKTISHRKVEDVINNFSNPFF